MEGKTWLTFIILSYKALNHLIISSVKTVCFGSLEQINLGASPKVNRSMISINAGEADQN